MNAFKRAWPAYSVEHQYGFDGYLDPHSFYFWMLTSGGFAIFGMFVLLVSTLLYCVIKIQTSTLPRGTKTLSLSFSLGAAAVLCMETIGTDLRVFGIQNIAVVYIGLTIGLALRAKSKIRSVT